jgi:hypothetical protein
VNRIASLCLCALVFAGCAGNPPVERPQRPAGQGASYRLEIVDRADSVTKGSPYDIKVQSAGPYHPPQVRIFVQLEEGGDWLQFPAVRAGETEYRMTMHSVHASFTYYAKAGATETPRYTVQVK